MDFFACIGAALLAIPLACSCAAIGVTGVAALAGALCVMSLIPNC